MTGILIREGDGPWLEPAETGYALESQLQDILASHPELIPGVSATAVTCREFQSDVGPADIVVVDSTGELTLVECKLASNPQIRREVVGQMFDYASRLWKMDIDEFAAKWRLRSPHPLALEETDGEFSLKEALARNLADGRFRIVLAVDVINPAMKRMIEYLNAMAGPRTSVMAVEYSRLKQGSIEILMPHVYGQELAEIKSSTDPGNKTIWHEEKYRRWIQENDAQNEEKFSTFLTIANKAGLTFQGSLSMQPAGSISIVNRSNVRLGTVSLFHFKSQGTSVELNFLRMSKMSADELPNLAARDLFLQHLADIHAFHEVSSNLQSSGFASRRPNVPLSAISKEDMQQVVNALVRLTEA